MHAGREFMERFWYHVKNLVNAHTGNKENPHGVTKEQIGLGNVENKSSEMIRAEMTSGDVTDALGYTPSNVSHTHPVSQVTGLTGSRALVSDSSGHPAVSGVTATELGYLDGATSNIQNQINSLNSNLTNVEESVDGLNGNIKFIQNICNMIILYARSYYQKIRYEFLQRMGRNKHLILCC